MRAILILWAIPLILFWGWYGLSAYDINFGLYFLKRDFHDLIFRIYSDMTGIAAAEIPGWLAGIFFVDTLILLGLAALRWHKHWLPQTYQWIQQKIVSFQKSSVGSETIYGPLNSKPIEQVPSSHLIGPVPPGG